MCEHQSGQARSPGEDFCIT